jgi:hypothetical protein
MFKKGSKVVLKKSQWWHKDIVKGIDNGEIVTGIVNSCYFNHDEQEDQCTIGQIMIGKKKWKGVGSDNYMYQFCASDVLTNVTKGL